MFDSLDVRTQPVATAGISTAAANTSASGGVFGDLADLFGSSNNTGLVSHTVQTTPQQVCVSAAQIMYANQSPSTRAKLNIFYFPKPAGAYDLSDRN